MLFVELLVIPVYLSSRTGIFQRAFELNDARLMIILGAVFAFGSYLFGLMKGRDGMTPGCFFRGQIVSVTFVVTLVSIGNIDLFLTKYHPSRYKTGGEWKRQYSYFLTNSYDNYEEWGEVMLEALDRGKKLSERYPEREENSRFLCAKDFPGLQSALKKHHDYVLLRHPASLLLQDALIIGFNKREARAANWLRANETLLEDFYNLLEGDCQTA
jgi:hypothetical protein